MNLNSKVPSFWVISALIGVSTLGLFWTTDVDAILPSPKSNLDLFLESDVVLMGTIISETVQKSESNESKYTTFEISVDRYLKNSLSEEIISVNTIVSYPEIPSPENFFKVNQNVFLYLTLSNENYVISPNSVAYFENFTEFLIPPPLKLFKHGFDSAEIPCKSFHVKICRKPGPSQPNLMPSHGFAPDVTLGDERSSRIRTRARLT